MSGDEQRPTLRAAIFDVDGTLAETERDGHRPAFNRAFRAHHLPYEWSVEEYGGLLSTAGGRHRLARYLASKGRSDDIDMLAEAVHATKTQIFSEWVDSGKHLAPRPGVAELLGDLRTGGITLAVASTGRRAWMVPLLRRLFPPDTFEVVVTGDDVERLKPDPEAYLVALERLGIGAEEAIAVEDSPAGLAAARAAGIACLVVASQYNATEAFPGAVAVVGSYVAPAGAAPARAPRTEARAACTGGFAEGVTAASLVRLHSAAGCSRPPG